MSPTVIGRAICRCGGESYEHPAVGPQWKRCVRCLDYISLGPSSDTAEALVEIQLAARLAEVYTLWEPGPGRETAEMLWIAVALTNDAKHVSIPTDAEIDKVFAEAPATIREVQEQLRGVVTP